MRSVLLVTAVLAVLSSGAFAKNHTNIVLLGATGDLAKKYLWQSLYSLYVNAPADETFHIYAGARNDVEAGQKLMKEILSANIKCDKLLPEDACADVKNRFSELVEYVQLKTDQDYVNLAKTISARPEEETGRLFYLSIPPFAYNMVTALINSHLRPKAPAWLRVVVEKPFGSDFNSAREMAQSLAHALQEHEIYRIDHYLGKRGVKQIAAFKAANPELFSTLWRKEHIQRVDIVMNEKDDCRHRTNFYDSYGVIRDVLQNHLTEILALVAADTSDMRSWGNVKAALFDQTSGSSADTLIGQYGEYNRHVQEDKRDGHAHSITPTFAASVLHVKNERWAGVPFVLSSGKSLSERRAYVKITFRHSADHICIDPHNCEYRDIVFNIQGGALDAAATIITGQFPGIKVPEGWTSSGSAKAGHLLLTPPENLGSDAPYNALLAEVYRGIQDDFVTTHALLQSWKIWTPIIEGLVGHSPRLYGKGGRELLFKVDKTRKISYVHESNSHRHSEL